MQWLEQKYVSLLSGQLRNYSQKSQSLYNFSCPICGDSDSNKRKARGYIYNKKDKSLYHCHNCGVTMSVSNFIKTVDRSLYDQFLMEKLQMDKDPKTDLEQFVEKMKRPVFESKGLLKGLKKVSQLSPEHPIKKYIVARKIPTPYHAKLYVCPNFYHFTNGVIPAKFDERALNNDETRLLIPFVNKDKVIHAYQGRSFKSSAVKYITIVVDDTIPKIYGLDTVDFDRKTYVMEGPIDSMFIENSIATAGGDLVSALQGFDQQAKASMVVVYDNEPRSKDTVRKMEKAIAAGYRVCIWPSGIAIKDINDMVKAGLTPDYIRYIIDTNTFSGLKATLQLKSWSKL